MGSEASKFYRACETGDVSGITKALTTDVQHVLVHARDAEGYTGLHHACKKGNTDVAKLLLDNGADVNAVNKDGATPLALACQYGHDQTVHYLVKQRRADTGIPDKQGSTAHHISSINGRADIVNHLVACDRRWLRRCIVQLL